MNMMGEYIAGHKSHKVIIKRQMHVMVGKNTPLDFHICNML